MTVDLVYSWVDGGRPDFQDAVRRHATTARDANPERFRDTFQLLKYSLRSVERFAPWASTIVVITQRPQVPQWLNRDHPRIRIVHHDELFDRPEELPTFNSRAIESYLHRVPTNSDYFVYLNDDFLFGRPTETADFVLDDGRVRVLGTKHAETWRARLANLVLLKSQISHSPLVIYRPDWRSMIAQQAAAIAQIRAQRFRAPGGPRVVDLYRRFMVSSLDVRRAIVPAYQGVRLHRPHNIRNLYAWQWIKLSLLERLRPKFYCMNDDQGPVPDPRVVQLVRQFLERYYPEPSGFELQP